ncbi:MAG: radical SAM/Cys-rich domain protein [Gammaproteobacteria bacterium]|nr:radical SAM/Cys-rich domain protein [Gammaproteobacteria bacterium]NIN62333.1 radical SAM/Cys-rich domain protein [Gammaproteobacteria bacterium]NIO62342.1 radical SAM/Cys-rich domain protein [Gammaproteobacteria bacterium]NIP49633.1 radical SAM/Cys-rich domain protein [Gammaproteobacteria bacterium]NIQ10858.1 radical SAM/Cys-rich domain protein [Gammaproteobacteria bacterium]
MQNTLHLLQPTTFPDISRRKTETLQINIGLKCNQQCIHCHVNSSPKRTEAMSPETLQQVVDFIEQSGVETLDITGGAPELHPGFRSLVEAVQAFGTHVIDRCNLTILLEPGQETLAEFLATYNVEITASLPCYSVENVDRQRGRGVFEKSIRALQSLNQLGYGQENSGRLLNLVYNPQGPSLPPNQATLEADYKRILKEKYNISFNQLFTLCNMPIKRFGSMLISNNQFDDYMTLLKQAHREENLDNVMCRSLISVDWQGYVYDCDFNQILGLELESDKSEKLHITDLMQMSLEGKPIITGNHCFGCTAGQGSSCGGALS